MSQDYSIKSKLVDYYTGLMNYSIEERDVLSCHVIADKLMVITKENKFVFKKTIF